MTTPSINRLDPGDYLDCSGEVTAIKAIPVARRVWLGRDIDESDWLIKFDPPAQDEIHRAADFVTAHPVANRVRTPADLDLADCKKHFARLSTLLNEGAGFAVMDRLPVDYGHAH